MPHSNLDFSAYSEAVVTAVASAVISHENVKVLPSQPDSDAIEIDSGSNDDDTYDEEEVVDGDKPIFADKTVEVQGRLLYIE